MCNRACVKRLLVCKVPLTFFLLKNNFEYPVPANRRDGTSFKKRKRKRNGKLNCRKIMIRTFRPIRNAGFPSTKDPTTKRRRTVVSGIPVLEKGPKARPVPPATNSKFRKGFENPNWRIYRINWFFLCVIFSDITKRTPTGGQTSTAQHGGPRLQQRNKIPYKKKKKGGR